MPPKQNHLPKEASSKQNTGQNQTGRHKVDSDKTAQTTSKAISVIQVAEQEGAYKSQ